MKLSTTYKIFEAIKRPLRFLKDWWETILLIIALVVIIWLCCQL